MHSACMGQLLLQIPLERCSSATREELLHDIALYYDQILTDLQRGLKWANIDSVSRLADTLCGKRKLQL